MQTIEFNQTWISGKFESEIWGNIEINTAYSYLAIGEDWFFQGSESDNAINEIFDIWNNHGNITPLQAAEKWANIYLY